MPENTKDGADLAQDIAVVPDPSSSSGRVDGGSRRREPRDLAAIASNTASTVARGLLAAQTCLRSDLFGELVLGHSLNTTAPAARRRGRAAIALPARYIAVLEDYTATQTAPLTRRGAPTCCWTWSRRG